MVLGPVGFPAEIHCTTVSVLRNCQLSRLGVTHPLPHPLKLHPIAWENLAIYLGTEGTGGHVPPCVTTSGKVPLCSLQSRPFWFVKASFTVWRPFCKPGNQCTQGLCKLILAYLFLKWNNSSTKMQKFFITSPQIAAAAQSSHCATSS